MSSPVPLAYHVLEPDRLGLVVHPSTEAGRAVYLSADEVLADHPEVAWLMDGPMWDSPNLAAYRMLDRAAGVDYASRHPSRGATLSVVGGRASFADGDHVADGADVAVQGPFSVVVDGHVAFPANRETVQVWRAGLGLLTDGRLLWCVGHGGMATWASRIAAAKFDGAKASRVIYTDGGHSTLLAQRGGPRWGFPGDNPRIFGWLVERDGPATAMPPPAPVQGGVRGRPPSGSSGAGAARLGAAEASAGDFWMAVPPALAALADRGWRWLRR